MMQTKIMLLFSNNKVLYNNVFIQKLKSISQSNRKESKKQWKYWNQKQKEIKVYNRGKLYKSRLKSAKKGSKQRSRKLNSNVEVKILRNPQYFVNDAIGVTDITEHFLCF